MDGPRPILGLMNQPFTGERFWSDGRARALARPQRQGPAHQDARRARGSAMRS